MARAHWQRAAARQRIAVGGTALSIGLTLLTVGSVTGEAVAEHDRSAPPTSARAASILSNGSFSSGLSGWSGPASLTSAGRTGDGAVLTAGESGAVAVRHTKVGRKVRSLSHFRGSVWVRTTKPGTRVTLAFAQASPGRERGVWSKERVLKDQRWHRISTTGIAPKRSRALTFKVSATGLGSGGRLMVDEAGLVPLGRVLMHADFEGTPEGRIAPGDFMRSVGGSNDASYDYEDTTIATGSGSHGRVIRTRLEKGTIRNKPSGNNGIVVFVPLRKQVDSACIRYDIRFSEKFDWSLGGKLPGLLGVAPGVSPSVPAGGHPAGSQGWSTRLMWLTPKSYSWAGPVNKIITYLYHPDQDGQYGDNVSWGRGVKRERWHTIKQCTTMNTPNRFDGRLTAWLDGRKVLNRTNIRYRTRSDVHISHLSWSIFRGGGTSNWAGKRTNHIDIDNVVIY